MTQFKDVIFEKNVVVHCPEEWMANELLKYADSKERKWEDKDSYLNCNCWNRNKHNTCYYLHKGLYGNVELCDNTLYKVLHYNDVVIKEEENNMETYLKHELKIKGREAKIGDVLWRENIDRSHSKVRIVSVKIIDRGGTVYFEPVDNKYNLAVYGVDINDEEYFINKYFSWEKPIIYQLPDTEGNLSEVKVGQKIYNNILAEQLHIVLLEDGNIEVCNDKGVLRVFDFNIHNSMRVPIYTTNKPKRDFSPYFDWNQSPNGYDFGSVDKDGRAYWYKGKPTIDINKWRNGGCFCDAGFRQNLINPETGKVDDWKDSLVERPKGK